MDQQKETALKSTDVEVFINHILEQITKLREISLRIDSIAIKCYGPSPVDPEINDRMEPLNITEKLRDLDDGLEIVISEMDINIKRIEIFI